MAGTGQRLAVLFRVVHTRDTNAAIYAAQHLHKDL